MAADRSDSQKSHSDAGGSIKQRVYAFLDKNPTLTAKLLCQIAGLDYSKYADYVAHIRTAWKYDPRKEHGLKCSVHAWRGWIDRQVPLTAEVRAAAERKGWLPTRARNRWLLWKDQLGRLQWFETGRVNLYVRKPADTGKVMSLICHGFSWTELVTDTKDLQAMFKAVRFKGAHYVFDLGFRGEKPVVIDLFGPSMGMVIKLFDKTHPTGLEVLAHYPDWGEKNERLFRDLQQFLAEFRDSFLRPPEKPGRPSVDYAR